MSALCALSKKITQISLWAPQGQVSHLVHCSPNMQKRAWHTVGTKWVFVLRVDSELFSVESCMGFRPFAYIHREQLSDA